MRRIDNFIDQLTLSVVALTTLVTTLWIGIIRAFVFRTRRPVTAYEAVDKN